MLAVSEVGDQFQELCVGQCLDCNVCHVFLKCSHLLRIVKQKKATTERVFLVPYVLAIVQGLGPRLATRFVPGKLS